MRYVADDGTYFDTEKECIEYEAEQKAILYCFVMYDEQLNVVSAENINRIEYAHVLSRPQEVAEYIYQNIGYERDGSDSEGIFRIHEDGYWQNVDTLINEYTKQVESLKAVKAGIYSKENQ